MTTKLTEKSFLTANRFKLIADYKVIKKRLSYMQMKGNNKKYTLINVHGPTGKKMRKRKQDTVKN